MYCILTHFRLHRPYAQTSAVRLLVARAGFIVRTAHRRIKNQFALLCFVGAIADNGVVEEEA